MPSYSWTLSIPSPAVGTPSAPGLVYIGEADVEPPDWGFDILAFPSLDMTWTPRRDHVVLADAVLRRWFTPRGRLWAHPDYGMDIRDYLNDEVTIERLMTLKAEAEAQAEQDERILACQVRLSYDPREEKLTLKAALDSEAGPFGLVAAVTAVSTTMWLEE